MSAEMLLAAFSSHVAHLNSIDCVAERQCPFHFFSYGFIFSMLIFNQNHTLLHQVFFLTKDNLNGMLLIFLCLFPAVPNFHIIPMPSDLLLMALCIIFLCIEMHLSLSNFIIAIDTPAALLILFDVSFVSTDSGTKCHPRCLNSLAKEW